MLVCLWMFPIPRWFVGQQTFLQKASLILRPFPPPVLDCLQYGWGRLGRSDQMRLHQVDTRGAMPDEILEALSCTIRPRAEGQSMSKAASIPFIIHDTRNGSTRNGTYYGRAPPPVCCLPDVIARDQIYQSPPHICILQMVKYGSGNGLGRRPIAPLEYRVREKTVDSLCVYSAGREGYPWASTDHWEWRFWGRRVIVLDLEKQKF